MPTDDDLHAALLSIAAERSAEAVLQRIADAAQQLTAADYAAVGVPDGAGGFTRFITTGIDDEHAARIGPLPRTHGLLGAQLESGDAYRTDDVRCDPRFQGWPSPHPEMVPFLSVPVAVADARGAPAGALYVARHDGGHAFTDSDEERLAILAGHAAVAMENAQLWERTRELVMADEQAHLARELHDAMTQRLFSLRLVAKTAAGTLPEHPEATQEHLETIVTLAGDTLGELRSLITGLRPTQLDRDGLAATLTTHVDLLVRAHSLPITLDIALDHDLPPRIERELFRVVQEALHNVVRHASATQAAVRLESGITGLDLEITDNGAGFDPGDAQLRATRLGLSSMRHRARSLGGRLTITSAPGDGTAIRLRAPHGR